MADWLDDVFYRHLKARLFSLNSYTKPISVTPHGKKANHYDAKISMAFATFALTPRSNYPLSPRSGPLLVLLLGVAGIVHAIHHRPSFRWLRTPPVYALGAFLSYLFLTSFWSTVPERSFEQAFRLTLLAFFGLASFSLVRSLDEHQKQRVTQCLFLCIISRHPDRLHLRAFAIYGGLYSYSGRFFQSAR